MLNYLIRRLLLVFPTLIGITLLVFMVMALSPGGVTGALLSAEGNMRPKDREALRAYLNRRYGLDRPLLLQYGRWLNNISPVGFALREDGSYGAFGLKSPDLGESFHRRRPVSEVILEALPVTLVLNLLSIPIVYCIAITSGIMAAQRRGTLMDVGAGTVLIGLYSVPTMWAGVMLIGFLANRDYLQLFPTGGMHDTMAAGMHFLPRWSESGFSRGWLLDAIWHLVLPVLCMTYGGFAFLSKLMRAAVLENLSSDFVRTARAKGVDERAVLYRHVLRNSILPLITVAASILPGLLGGSVIIEYLFSLNGMGSLMIEAIRQKDVDLVLSETFIVAVISLLSLLVADLCYAIADPRVSYE